MLTFSQCLCKKSGLKSGTLLEHIKAIALTTGSTQYLDKVHIRTKRAKITLNKTASVKSTKHAKTTIKQSSKTIIRKSNNVII